MAADEQRRQGFDPAASAGLFVGVSRFEDLRLQEVPYAVDDAVDLANLFAEDLGLLRAERVVLALSGEPQKEMTQRGLQRLVSAGARVVEAKQTDIYRLLPEVGCKAGEYGMFLVTVATHGFSDQGGDYLIAADSLLHRAERTGVAVNELFDEVARVGCPRRLVLLDACRERLTEGTRGGTTAAMTSSFAAAIAAAEGQVVLAGATLGGYAYDDVERGNGVFTAAVLDGLLGAAPMDRHGFITVDTLGDFVQWRVKEWVLRHRPDHAHVSQGIEHRIAGAARAWPLAVNPEHREAVERYRGRREAALAKLRQNLGSVLSGVLHDQVMGLLPLDGSGEGAEELLGEIEALDGSLRSRRSLRDYLRERMEKGATGAPVVPGTTERRGTSHQLEVDAFGHAETTVGTRPNSGTAEKRHPRRPTRFSASFKASLIAGGLLSVLVINLVIWSEAFDYVPATTRSAEPLAPEPGAHADGPLGMRFRFVPAGTYLVGSPKEEPGRDEDETRHQVELTHSFWLAETEVTQAQWSALAAENPSKFRACGEDCPVETVSWFEAVTCANLLSDQVDLPKCYELTGCKGTLGSPGYTCEGVTFVGLDCPGYRLPTEAEWEVAARAGTEAALYTGGLTLRGARDGPELDSIAWYGGNSGVTYEGGSNCSGWSERQYDTDACGTHPVGQKQPNRWGLRDMLGNVIEWTWDAYSVSPAGDGADSLQPKQDAYRVIRGGSWYSLARNVRAADRFSRSPSSRYSVIGFRLARGQGTPKRQVRD